MKKVLLIVIMMVNVLFVMGQNDTVLYITDYPEYIELCPLYYQHVIVYAEENCDSFMWWVDGAVNQGGWFYDNPLIIEIVPPVMGNAYINVRYTGCEINQDFNIYLTDATMILNPCTWTIWKHQGQSITIEPIAGDTLQWWGVNCIWSTGEETNTIEVTETGIYTCTIYTGCSMPTRIFIVRDNVELYRATVDLETNLNKTTWQVTEEQAEYITDVKVYRDGLLVGTAPYEQGYFMDNIGSDNAARNYRIVGVSVEGEDCPIESYEKGTIHTTYYQDVNGNLNMTWNVPYVEEGAQGTLTYFQICKYDPNTGELTVVDQVNASITDYTCGVNQFDGGYAVIAAVFNDGKGVEELSFSNLTTDILGLGENGETAFRIYPNPAKGHFTVAGNGTMRITNVLGQEIMTKEIHETETVELPMGMYFVTLNGNTRKIVVE